MPLFLPECHEVFDDTSSIWMCARSISFGIFCLMTMAVAVVGCQRILPIFWATQWYATNMLMLALTVLQMALLVYECFIQNSSKLLVVTKYCRGVQVAISCMLYGKLACDLMNRSKLYDRVLAPIVVATMGLMTVDALMVLLLEDEIDCHHLTWIVMSMAGAVLAVSFALPGRIVLEEIKSTSRLQQKFLSTVSSAVAELEQSHHQLWILLLFNMISTMSQLLVDVYVTYGVVGSRTCNSMFFEDGSGVFEQTLRLAISLVSYVLPNWAIIYVFFLLPRFQFSTALDLPDLSLDDHAYQLLDTTDPTDVRV
ncbi:TPA: hypothetical protein N0F65_001518 [Lagenidium giganteum]|uniref:Uncharacterized protein n=1 Tax=Lagenidium giganteum TaxID=4803 RepID=A0AAV2Z070_9STRA|nr:TPA: hypothetical protein N0F65_001518 [Lagenidium giganteum]